MYVLSSGRQQWASAGISERVWLWVVISTDSVIFVELDLDCSLQACLVAFILVIVGGRLFVAVVRSVVDGPTLDVD